jgi:hypothetical protein
MPLDQRGFEIPNETKPEVFSLEGLRDWLTKQNPAMKYKYYDCSGGCLIGQYLIARTGKSFFNGRQYGEGCIPLDAVPFEMRQVSLRKPCTFGDALSRCKDAIAARKGA